MKSVEALIMGTIAEPGEVDSKLLLFGLKSTPFVNFFFAVLR
jgi:hypothetical protein